MAPVRDDLDHPDRIECLNAIDKLRELGVGGDVSLPQLIVVGDQSSGKSSLLEGITGIAFPVSGDVCIRFATQIILKRCDAEEAQAVVSIIPGGSVADDEEMRETLLGFHQSFAPENFKHPNELGTILAEATEHMGLPPVDASIEDVQGYEHGFTDHVVRIEVSGPDQPHLSVIDLPGLFHNPTQYQTLEDQQMIRSIVEERVADKRTIILAVCNAMSNLANQEVFQLARNVDRHGLRTVGVITKCDVVAKGDEGNVMKIARNQYQELRHGWFVVKNRSTQDIAEGVSIKTRHKRQDAFFASTAPWSSLHKNQKGVRALKEYLGKLLSDHIRAELPHLLQEIQTLRDEAYLERQKFGDPRQSADQQRRFLGDIAERFHREVDSTLKGDYVDDEDDDDEQSDDDEEGSAFKLRNSICKLNDGFKRDMQKNGHTYIFRTAADEEDRDYLRKSEHKEKNIYDWIRKVHLSSRGVELPDGHNPFTVKRLFRGQSARWNTISGRYLDRVVTAIKLYAKELLKKHLHDRAVRRKIQARMEEDAGPVITRARERLERCVNDERSTHPKTLDDRYSENLEKASQDRMEHKLRKMGYVTDPANIMTLRFPDAVKVAKQLASTNESTAAQRLHDPLKANYGVSVARFIDSVLLGPIEAELLGDRSPAKVFSPAFVNTLTEHELADFAAESHETTIARSECEAKVQRLQKALKMIRSLAI